VTRLLREVRTFVAARGAPTVGAVAVSGGADSVALLRALHAVPVPLVVAHVNHQLRGAASDADEAFVRALCAALQVPCFVKRVDVAALAAGANLEATAREVRYKFFAEVCAETGAQWVATAHTADDQAETVLHRLVRGTGLQGLRGIARARGEIVRPLLTCSRADVLAHLAEIGQAYREDASNADTRFTRNRIRHELLPLLRTFNPDVVSALARVAEHASEAHEIVTHAARELLARAELPRAANAVILDASALGESRVLIRAVVRLVWEREGWPVGGMSFDSWERAVEVACRDAGACDFPDGVTMRHTGRVVQLARRE
jgi:tRNA(Ile)-lysidine synthase